MTDQTLFGKSIDKLAEEAETTRKSEEQKVEYTLPPDIDPAILDTEADTDIIIAIANSIYTHYDGRVSPHTVSRYGGKLESVGDVNSEYRKLVAWDKTLIRAAYDANQEKVQEIFEENKRLGFPSNQNIDFHYFYDEALGMDAFLADKGPLAQCIRKSISHIRHYIEDQLALLDTENRITSLQGTLDMEEARKIMPHSEVNPRPELWTIHPKYLRIPDHKKIAPFLAVLLESVCYHSTKGWEYLGLGNKEHGSDFNKCHAAYSFIEQFKAAGMDEVVDRLREKMFERVAERQSFFIKGLKNGTGGIPGVHLDILMYLQKKDIRMYNDLMVMMEDDEFKAKLMKFPDMNPTWMEDEYLKRFRWLTEELKC